MIEPQVELLPHRLGALDTLEVREQLACSDDPSTIRAPRAAGHVATDLAMQCILCVDERRHVAVEQQAPLLQQHPAVVAATNAIGLMPT